MQIVIEISKEEYELIVNSEDCGLNELTKAVAKGIVLPKKHGRLIDVDKLHISDWITPYYDMVNYADTVIPSDK